MSINLSSVIAFFFFLSTKIAPFRLPTGSKKHSFPCLSFLAYSNALEIAHFNLSFRFHLENNESGDYTFTIKRTIELPIQLKEHENISNEVDCFSLQYEKYDNTIAAGN